MSTTKHSHGQEAAPHVHGSAVIEVKGDAPVFCPSKTSLWSSHPRVYLAPDEKGMASCPYCGTTYHVTGARSHH